MMSLLGRSSKRGEDQLEIIGHYIEKNLINRSVFRSVENKIELFLQVVDSNWKVNLQNKMKVFSSHFMNRKPMIQTPLQHY